MFKIRKSASNFCQTSSPLKNLNHSHFTRCLRLMKRFSVFNRVFLIAILIAKFVFETFIERNVSWRELSPMIDSTSQKVNQPKSNLQRFVWYFRFWKFWLPALQQNVVLSIGRAHSREINDVNFSENDFCCGWITHEIFSTRLRSNFDFLKDFYSKKDEKKNLFV